MPTRLDEAVGRMQLFFYKLVLLEVYLPLILKVIVLVLDQVFIDGLLYEFDLILKLGCFEKLFLSKKVIWKIVDPIFRV